MKKTKIDIFSGFLGAGKTTLIKKLIAEAYKNEKLVLIENEFGEIGIDGGFMQDAGIEVTEMNSGCICCSLVGDFGEALKKVIDEYHPERILIEPSGVGKLSDVIRAVQGVDSDEIELNSYTAVCDAGKVKMYMRNFGEFYNNQIEHAAAVVMSHTDKISDEKIAAAVEMIREHNPHCAIVTTPWSELTGEQILAAIEHRDTLADELKALEDEETCPVCGHHHHDHDDDDHDEHDHHDHDEHDHHDHDEHDHHDHDEHDHHDHDHHDHDDHDHHHHHDHEQDGECCCGHDHHDHDHHHADDVFNSWGKETSAKFSAEELREKLMRLEDEETYGAVLRAKGIVADADGGWLHFDYVPGEADVRSGSASTIGRICVIGAGLKEEAVEKLF